MAQFSGRMQGENLELTNVILQFDEDRRLRVLAGRIAVGSWAMHKVKAERSTIYRFDLDIDGDGYEFFPDDPLGFSEAIGAVVDLTDNGGRFGLKARIAKAIER